MLTSSALYAPSIPRPHQRIARVTSRTPDGTVLAADIEILSGDVTAQLSSRVTRSASFSLTDEWFPAVVTDPLSPTHAIVSIEAGVSYPDGLEELFPVFTGRVYAAERGDDGRVVFRADDLAADVLAADFEQPENSQPGASIVAECRRLITDGYENAVFGTDDVDDSTVPRLAWDDDRGRALDDLAAVVEGRWFTLGDGSFVVRRYTYTDLAPVITLTDGDPGTLTSASVSLTADGAANAVVVLSERLDGEEPIRVVERNLNNLSAFRYGGEFGKRVKKVRMQSAATVADAQRVARSQLVASTALSRQWSMSCVPDYRLEPGDVAAVTWRAISDVQILDSITYPLATSAPMTLSGRSSLDVTSVS